MSEITKERQHSPRSNAKIIDSIIEKQKQIQHKPLLIHKRRKKKRHIKGKPRNHDHQTKKTATSMTKQQLTLSVYGCI